MELHKKRLFKGFAVNFIAVAFNQGSSLIASVLVARILLQQSFGEYAMILSTLQTMAGLSQMAIGYTASKYVAEFRCVDRLRTGRIMGLCSIVSLFMAATGTSLFLFSTPWLANSMLDAPHLTSGFRLGSVFLFCSIINGYQIGLLSGLESYSGLARAGVLSGIFSIVAIAGGAVLAGLDGALIGLSLSAIVRLVVHRLIASSQLSIHGITTQWKGSLSQEKSILWNFAIPAAFAGLYSLPMIWIANTLLVQQAKGYEAMAHFAAANNLRALVLFLPNIANSVGLTILNNEKSTNEKKHFIQVYRFNVINIFFLTLIGAISLGVVGRFLLETYGRSFGEGYLVLTILLISTVFEGTSSAMYQYVQSKAKIWSSLFFISIPRETFLTLSAYFLIPSFLGEGLAAAYLVSALLGLVLTFIVVFVLWDRNE
jgi:O-antigen/teichoic acid export membrane protein